MSAPGDFCNVGLAAFVRGIESSLVDTHPLAPDAAAGAGRTRLVSPVPAPISMGANCAQTGDGGKSVRAFQRGLDHATRLAAGLVDAEALRWLQSGLQAWLRAGGERSLAKCLGLPDTRKRMALLQQTYWLTQAAQQIECSSQWGGSLALAAELDAFLSRGTWQAWRERAAPPAGASRLREALFHVAKATGGESISARHIDRIVGQIFAEKCRT